MNTAHFTGAHGTRQSPPDLAEQHYETFARWLVAIAESRFRSDDDEGPGLASEHGMSVTALRRHALRWCDTRGREEFGREEAAALRAALRHFDDSEFEAFVAGLFYST
jgi:uncharacterized protein YfaT (DUF1175 family)